MKFTFTIQLETASGDSAQQAATAPRKIVLASSPSEVLWHIALKFIGYLLYFEDEPRVEEGVGWRYKPDLVALDDRSQVKLWIDCGNIAVKKIDRVATWLGEDARFCILRRDRREAEVLRRNMEGRIKRAERVSLIWFDEGFVDLLAANFDQVNRCKCLRAEDSLAIELANRHGKQDLRTTIYSG